MAREENWIGFSLLVLLQVPTLPATAGEEVAAGELQLGGAGTVQSAALHLDSRVHFTITGMMVQVQLSQSFRNDSGRWQEGNYVFPLPDRAAVNRMRLRVGERVIEGEIRERQAARAEYLKARAAGRRTSLVEQQRPNLFSNRIANIGPGETVEVELSYTQTLDFRDGVFSLRFPMTLTPRYIPGKPRLEEPMELVLDSADGWARSTDQVPDAQHITPPLLSPTAGAEREIANPIEISASLDMGMPLASIESPWHEISVSPESGGYRIGLPAGVVSMDRDFVLRWRPVTGSEPQAALFGEAVNGAGYALLMLVPPWQDSLGLLTREVVFVIDTSGSMGGNSIRQARASLRYALDQLQAGDSFNIIEFNSSARALFRTSVTATAHNLDRAREFVRHLDAGGGTEMRTALELAMRRMEESSLLRQVVFITDGAVGNEAALFRQIEGDLGDSRLFTVGIGSAPNSWFMRKAARFGRGRYTYVGDTGEVKMRMDELFAALSQTLVTDIQVDWGGVVECWPGRIPELYRGEPLILAARYSDAEAVREITVTGKLHGRQWQRRLLYRQDGSHPGVATSWARRKIEGLLDERVLGRPEDEVRAEVLPLALEHELLSPYTSFIAVEKRVSRPASETPAQGAIPNVAPAGQSAQAYAWPKTGAGAAGQVLLGCLLLLAWLLAVLFQRQAVTVEPPCS